MAAHELIATPPPTLTIINAQRAKNIPDYIRYSTDGLLSLMIMQFIAFSTAQMRGYGKNARVNMAGMTITGAEARSTKKASANSTGGVSAMGATATGGSTTQGDTTVGNEDADDKNRQVAIVTGNKRQVHPL